MRVRKRVLGLVCGGLVGFCPPAWGLDAVEFAAPGAARELADSLRGASLVLQAQREGRTEAQDIFAAAQADYGRLIGALYAAGHYSGIINIKIDGREASGIAPLNAPAAIRNVTIEVQPGAGFTFGRAAVGPLAPGTDLPRGFRAGEPALSGVIRSAAESAVDGWREAGHPKAGVGGQAITADHARSQLEASITVAPGPQARLGALRFVGAERMREERLHAIAGFPSGEVYSPEAVRRSADRLRRTGAFRAVALAEAETLAPGDVLDVTATLTEEAPRRIGFGAEIASFDGLRLEGFWLHRNLFGGAERLRVEAEIAQIGARETGTDYRLGATFERPATFTPDTTFSLSAELARKAEDGYVIASGTAGVGLAHIFREGLTGRAGVKFTYSRVTDENPRRVTLFRNVAFPLGGTWDRRDNAFDARRGTYLDAEVMPFAGLSGTESGARLRADMRGFQPLGSRVVLAGRVQVGAVFGPSLAQTPRDYLFYSGGGGTVRGHPFQSLGVPLARAGLAGPAARQIGGARFAAVSAEVRGKVTDSIGLVLFYDYGQIGISSFGSGARSHAGAGLGLRYDTGIGPIRLDVAAPVSGSTGRGAQVYIGLGQAF